MSSPAEWLKGLEFSFIACDRAGHVAVVYPRDDSHPEWIRENWTQAMHEQVMPLLFDELPERTMALHARPDSSWAGFDARRGFFVYEYERSRDAYVLVCSPREPLRVSSEPGLALVPKLMTVEFAEVPEIPRLVLHQLTNQRELAPGTVTRTSG